MIHQIIAHCQITAKLEPVGTGEVFRVKTHHLGRELRYQSSVVLLVPALSKN